MVFLGLGYTIFILSFNILASEVNKPKEKLKLSIDQIKINNQYIFKKNRLSNNNQNRYILKLPNINFENQNKSRWNKSELNILKINNNLREITDKIRLKGEWGKIRLGPKPDDNYEKIHLEYEYRF